jgi:hypothetical protein
MTQQQFCGLLLHQPCDVPIRVPLPERAKERERVHHIADGARLNDEDALDLLHRHSAD